MAPTQGSIALSFGRVTLRAVGSPVWIAIFSAGLLCPWLARADDAAEAKTKRPLSAKSLPQVASINAAVRAGWESAKLTPSHAATDGEWCRRVFLDVIGRIPTVEELKKFSEEPAVDRKARLVDRLLGSQYVEEYARNWSTLWSIVLIGRSEGTERRTLVNREGLQLALRRALEQNMPYDRLVFELITAKGLNNSEAKETGKAAPFNGFVNFLTGKLQENGVQATAKTAQIFLGLQIQCTQCHNHPFNDWKQNQFWEMNAFFRQTAALRRFGEGRDIAAVELVNQDFAGEDNRPDEAVLFYELPNGLTKAAFPAFVDGTKLKTNSGFLADVDRRAELARLVVGSEYLSRALVNRIWAHFLGYGFTHRIDDMGPPATPSHPELLDKLAGEFKSGGYNLKELVRWIVLSEPYGLSSKVGARNKHDDPAAGETPMFSRFYLRQMRAEELYESLLVATEAQNTAGNGEKQEEAKRKWLAQFTVAFGTDDNDETTTFNGTIPQVLMMMNGDLINQAISTKKGSLLERLAADPKMNNAARINRVYLATLARRPTQQEIILANELMQLRKGDPVAALQDVWWAVLNSNEFILNH